MVKVSGPLIKVRGQSLSDGDFVCVVMFFGFGLSGSDCCAWAALQSRESGKNRAQMTDDATLVVGLRICMIKPPAHAKSAPCLRTFRRTRRATIFLDLHATRLLLSSAAELTPILLAANLPDHARPV